jgi:hypothetical protein
MTNCPKYGLIFCFCIAVTGCKTDHHLPPPVQNAVTSSSVTTGLYNLGIGVHAGESIMTGSYNICWGDFSCPGVTGQECIVDITNLGDETMLTPEFARAALDMTIPGITAHCPPDPKRDKIIAVLVRIASSDQRSEL